MDILDDRKLKTFLQNRSIKEGTRNLYIIEIKNYSEFLGLTPTEIINQAIEEEKAGIWLSERKIKEHLLDYKSYLIEKNYSPSNILKKLGIVKALYNEFTIQVPKIKYSKKNVRRETIEDLPTKDEIRNALSFANTKYKCIILILLSTGLRSSDVRQLKYNNFLKSLQDYINIPNNTFISIDEVIQLLGRNEDEKIITWKIVTQKTETPVTTFSTPETLDILLKFLKLKPPISLDSYLFTSAHHPERPIGKRAFMGYFQYLNDKCELGKVGKYVKLHSHSFRKLFGTLLIADGMSQLSVARLMGHSVRDIVESYIKVDETSLKNQYIEHMSVLSLEDLEVRKVTTDDKKKLDQILKILKDNNLLDQLPKLED